jgi:hypothetical protein
MNINYNLILNENFFDNFDELLEDTKIKLFNDTHLSYKSWCKDNKVLKSEYKNSYEITFNNILLFIKNNKALFLSKQQQYLFISDILFYNDDCIIKYLNLAGINYSNIDDFVYTIKKNKIIYKATKDNNISFQYSEEVEKLCTYLGINNKEFIINKILKLYYTNKDLFKNKEKIKD